jgi:hypothetical protein
MQTKENRPARRATSHARTTPPPCTPEPSCLDHPLDSQPFISCRLSLCAGLCRNVQIRKQHTLHNSAQFCTKTHNLAQPGGPSVVISPQHSCPLVSIRGYQRFGVSAAVESLVIEWQECAAERRGINGAEAKARNAGRDRNFRVSVSAGRICGRWRSCR